MTRLLPYLGGVLLLALALVAALVGQPTANDRMRQWQPQLEAMVDSREYHIDPGELFDLMYDSKRQLVMFDVREEWEYNLFHLVDARLVAPEDLSGNLPDQLPEDAVKVVMSNDEARAEEAWKLLRAQGVLNVYILAGGLNFWLDVYADGDFDRRLDPAQLGDDTLRHQFNAALGEMHPAARPGIETTPAREYEQSVKQLESGPQVQGGCG